MAHLHFRRTVYKSGGTAATDRVEYITRDAARDRRADRQIRYSGRADREDLVYTNSRNLPAWAAGHPVIYFRAAEQYERANGNAFEEWKITLPQELSPRQNMDLMRDLVDTIAGDRLPITYAFHCPATLDASQTQPHLHLLISGRQQDGMARPPAQHFKQYQRAHPERGGAPKDPALNHLRAVKQWRITIADVINLHLERAGQETRVHPETLARQGIDREPEPKLMPSESREYREEGKVSARMQAVLDTRATRQKTRAEEQASARLYWEARKETLGIVVGMTGAAQLAAIVEARAHRRDQGPAREMVEAAVVVEETQAQETAWPGQSLVQDVAALVAQMAQVGEAADGYGHVRMRLWDREPGMGI